MKFEDIKFIESKDKRFPGLVMVTRGGYRVLKAEVELAWAAVSRNAPVLDWSVTQTTETMIADPNWPEWTTSKRNRLGRAIRFFMDVGMLDVWMTNPQQTGTKKYLHWTLSPKHLLPIASS
jgi:hypothetical protein